VIAKKEWGCGDLEEVWSLFVYLIVWSLLTILSCKLATCLTPTIHVFLVCQPLILRIDRISGALLIIAAPPSKFMEAA